MRTKQQKGAKKNRRFHSLEGLEGRRMLAAHIVGNSNTYATIQAAVDAAVAGSVVTVDPGTYAEQVYVSKSITIRGAQAGVDARSNLRLNGGVAESIVTGAPNSSGQNSSAFYVAANNVTIDGFTVQGQTTAGDAGAGLVIAPSKAGTHIYNNIFQNNVSGLFLSNNSATNPAVIQYNVFRNNNNSGANGGRGIYTNGSISGGNLTNVLIDSNFFTNNRGSGGTTSLEAAIAFEAANAGEQSNITITNNSFDNNGKATLFFNTVGVTISGNYITNTLDQYSGTLRFEGNDQNVSITYNTIYDNTGPAVAVDTKGMPGDNAGFVVNYNNFFHNNIGWSSGTNMSVAFDGSVYDGTPDVRYNYWGSASGPSGDGPGTGDGVYGIGHVVSGGQWSVTKGGPEMFAPFATAPVGVNRSAYFGLPWSDGAPVQFEDYDHGGEGVAYHDTTSSNAGGKYRNREGVDLETTSDTGGGYDVYNTVAGEWLTYTTNLQQGGIFNLDMRVASQKAGGTFHVEVDGVNVTGTLTVPTTGGAQTWTTLTATGLNLTAGQHLLKFVFDTNGAGGTVGSFNWFKLTNTAPVAVPNTPTNLVAVASGFSAVNLSWSDNASNETGYVVERRLPGGNFAVIATLGANATSYTDTSILSSQAYDYRVKALGSAGNSGYSNIASVITGASQSVTYLSDLPFAGTPTNGWGPIELDQSVGGQNADDGTPITLNGVTYNKGLGVNATSDVSPTLGGAYKQFLADVGVDDHEQYDGSVDFQVFADGVLVYDSNVMTPTSATQHINLDMTGVQTLRLHVGDGGDGPDFDQADWADARVTVNGTTTPPPTAPSAPAALAASAASSTQINLNWSDVSGETSFIIERSTDGSTFTQLGTTSAGVTVYSDTTAQSGKQYWYRVEASNSAGTSGASNIATATTPSAPTAPAAPTGLTASAISQTRIDLTWSASSGASSYKIERSLDNGMTFTQIGTSTTASYSDTSATAGKTFVYRVRATNSVGDSNYSSTAIATTPAAPTVPGAPSGLAASAASFSQVNLTWSATANATSYKIERSSDNGVTFTQIGTSTTTSYSDTTVVGSSSYVYRIRATNSVGDSTYSTTASVTTPAAPTVTWTNAQVGVMGPAPVYSTSGGTYTLKGAGTGIGSTADSFQFVYQQLTGDGTIIARVTGVQNTSNTAQAGIMMRDGLAANATEVSVVANASSLYGVSNISRSKVGGSASTANKYFTGTPVWLKLVRSGNTITSYRSSDGSKWTKVSSQTIAMSGTIYVGLVVASKSSTTVNTSTFDNVSVTH